jgi:hypothetical protein
LDQLQPALELEDTKLVKTEDNIKIQSITNRFVLVDLLIIVSLSGHVNKF